ncbi:hypothetical protein ACET3Z_028980 [Daucus carota]
MIAHSRLNEHRQARYIMGVSSKPKKEYITTKEKKPLTMSKEAYKLLWNFESIKEMRFDAIKYGIIFDLPGGCKQARDLKARTQASYESRR